MMTVMVRLGWLICGFLAMCELVLRTDASTNCYRKTCHGIAYDSREAVCCGNQLHNGTGLSCCGDQPYNPATATCCKTTHGLFEAQVTQGLSENVSLCCGLVAYNELNEICCGSTIVDRPAAEARCCGEEAYDVETHLCCDETFQKKNTSNHVCCLGEQYNFMTQCCSIDVGKAKITKKLKDCPAISGVQPQKPDLQPQCTEPNTHRCGSSCYDPNKHRCCENKAIDPASDPHAALFQVYDAVTHVCCNGHVKPGRDQCCRETLYGSAQPGVLCCNNVLYKGREEGRECSDTSIPYNPAKGTICCSQFHGSPGQHCCGSEVYRPHDEICCDGHRYAKEKNLHCCGIKVYNIKDPKMKCCAGTLYNVAHLGNKHDVKCCGSALQNPQEKKVCCSSKDRAVLYSDKEGLKCCGHLHFNSSLWSCCAESLSPVQRSEQRRMTGCGLPSVNNLKETQICKELYIGIVQSVSPNSIVFSSVLKISGTNRNLHPEPSHYVLETPNHCSTPKLSLGKFYYFSDVEVFADFNHDAALQSLYSILNNCSPQDTTG